MAERLQLLMVDEAGLGGECDECVEAPVAVWVDHAGLCRACAERLIAEIREVLDHAS